jgi:hypothetical protein
VSHQQAGAGRRIQCFEARLTADCVADLLRHCCESALISKFVCAVCGPSLLCHLAAHDYIRHHVQTRLQAANVTSPVLLLATDANREMLSSSTGRPVSRLNVVLSAGVRVRFVVKTREVG